MCLSNWAKWVFQDRTSLHLGSWGGPAASGDVLLLNQPTSRVLEHRQLGLAQGTSGCCLQGILELNEIGSLSVLLWHEQAPAPAPQDLFPTCSMRSLPLSTIRAPWAQAWTCFSFQGKTSMGTDFLYALAFKQHFSPLGNQNSPPFFFLNEDWASKINPVREIYWTQWNV